MTAMDLLARTWTLRSGCSTHRGSRPTSRARRHRSRWVASDYIYQSIIRHGYDGIDGEEFAPLVNVTVGFRRRKGWVHLPQGSRLPVTVPALAKVVG